MSSAELIGVISGIISIVDASLKIYEACEDASCLPRCFRNVAARLPVVQDTLETAREILEEEDNEDKEQLSRVKSRDALVKILESCYDKAAMLNKTLQTIMPTQGASKTKRYVKAIKMLPAADRIESLMNGILHDVNVLAANHSVKSATRTQVNDLIDMIRKMKAEKREPIYFGRRTTVSFYNTGRGSQFIFDGQGNQKVSMGTGVQFRGTSTAPLYITLADRDSLGYFEPSPKRPSPKIQQHCEQSKPPPPSLEVADTVDNRHVKWPPSPKNFDIAVFCALKPEYDAVSIMFDDFYGEEGNSDRRVAGNGNTYTTGRIGKFNVVLTLLSRKGKASAAKAATSVSHSYPSLGLTLLVGICGGVPRTHSGEEIILGDVIISDSIFEYDLGTQYPNQFKCKNAFKDNDIKPNQDICNILQTLKSCHSRELLRKRTASYLQQLQDRAARKGREDDFSYPGYMHDRLFAPHHRHKHYSSEYLCLRCEAREDVVCERVIGTPCNDLGCGERDNKNRIIVRKRLELKRKMGKNNEEMALEPMLYVGTVASGDTVMQSGEHRDEISKDKNIIAFEMEGAGVRVVFPSCIIIKGVSDYADSHKNNLWKNYAAATAAAALKAILE